MTRIEGAVALVTGGRRGLGKAFVDAFLARGAAKVYATTRTPAPGGDGRVVTVPLDVTDEASVAELARTAGDVTIVVNNAGVSSRRPIGTQPVEEVQAVFDTNVWGPLRVSRHFAPILAANGGGALVTVNSALAWAAGAGAYGVSKAALWSLTNALRVELRDSGTHVLGVHLGYTDTEMTSTLDVVKNRPQDVAEKLMDALRDGEPELLVDEVSRRFKAALSGPVAGLSWRVVDGDVRVGQAGPSRERTGSGGHRSAAAGG